MKRFAIIAALTAGIFWNASEASAQYRPQNQTMTGRNITMTGRLQTNHNPLVARPVTSNSPQYTGVVPGGVSPYSSGGVILPAGGAPLGASLFPGLDSPNPSVYPSGGSGSLYGWSGWSRRR